MEKLIVDGVWTHRPNEKTPVEFSYMSDAAKQSYVYKIEQINEKERSTYEKVILRVYDKELSFRNKTISNDIETKVELSSTNIDATIPDETELIKNIPNLSKQDIKELLDQYYSLDYTNWEIDLRNSKIEQFIKNTSTIYAYTSYIIGLLTTYKSL